MTGITGFVSTLFTGVFLVAGHAWGDETSSKEGCLQTEAFRHASVTIADCSNALQKSDLASGDLALLTAQLGEGYYWNNQLGESIAAMRQALTLNPALNETRIQLAWALRYANKSDEAWQIIKEAVDKDPKSGRAIYSKGDFYFYDSAQHEIAKQDYLAALKLNPDYDLAHFGLASYYHYWENDYPKAIAEYDAVLAKPEETVNKQPYRSYDPLIQIKDMYQDALYHKASDLVMIGQPEKAVPILAQLADKYPDQLGPVAVLSEAYHILGKSEEAIAAADRGLKLDVICRCNQTAALFSIKIRNQFLLKKYDAALASIETFKANSSVHYRDLNLAFFYEGLIHKQRGEIGEARSAIVRAMEADNHNMQAALAEFIKYGYYSGTPGDAMSDKVKVALDACLADPKCFS